MRAFLVAALALAGCGDLFNPKPPEGYTCGAGGTCPPGQQCVPGEKVCRTPCTQTSISGMTGNNGQCTDINQNNSSTSGGYGCDYDHFCRPSCFNPGGSCAGCSGTNICDTTVNVCRPACGDGCVSGWGCTYVGSGGSIGVGEICAACRPGATSTFAAPSFADLVSYSGGTPDAITVANLDGDGHAEVIAVVFSANKLYVYRNDGTGGLMAPTSYPVSSPHYAVVADMNRDGKPDVVVTSIVGTGGGPVLFPGNGDGTLGAPVNGPTLPTTRLALGDFDGDGKPDVATSGSGTNVLGIVSADGAGGLKMLATFGMGIGASYVPIGAADLNGDKKLDAWADDEHGSINEFIESATAPNVSFGVGPNTSSSTRVDELTADINGDGKPDMVALQKMPGGTSGGFGYFLLTMPNPGNGGFMTSGMGFSVEASVAIASDDFDGNGKPDVAVLESNDGSKVGIELFSNDGSQLIITARLATQMSLPTTTIATGDVDGDGKPDLVFGLGAGGIGVMLNTTPSP